MAYGYDVVAPTVAPAFKTWLKRLGLVLLVAFGLLLTVIIASITLSFTLAVVLLFSAVFVFLADVVLYLVAFFAGIKQTLEEIGAQNVPQLRKEQFSQRYRRFMILSVVIIVVLVIIAVVNMLMDQVDPKDAEYVIMTEQIIGLVLGVGFHIATSVFFHATRQEHLKLYGAPQRHEIGGFDSIQAQDEEIFA